MARQYLSARTTTPDGVSVSHLVEAVSSRLGVTLYDAVQTQQSRQEVENEHAHQAWRARVMTAAVVDVDDEYGGDRDASQREDDGFKVACCNRNSCAAFDAMVYSFKWYMYIGFHTYVLIQVCCEETGWAQH